MFLTVPIPSELLNLFAMKERGERRETEMGLEIGLERHAETRLQRALKVRLNERFDLGS